MAGEIQIKGEPELHRALTQLEGELRDLSSVNAEVARELAQAIGARAPVLSGRLAASWYGSGESDKAEASSDLDYAGPQNYGVPSHNIEGTHYAEKALAESSSTIESTYRAGVARLCRKAET